MGRLITGVFDRTGIELTVDGVSKGYTFRELEAERDQFFADDHYA